MTDLASSAPLWHLYVLKVLRQQSSNSLGNGGDKLLPD